MLSLATSWVVHVWDTICSYVIHVKELKDPKSCEEKNIVKRSSTIKSLRSLHSGCPTLRQTDWDGAETRSKPTTAHIYHAPMVWADLDCFAHIIWALATGFATGLNQVRDKQQSATVQILSLTALYSFKIHSKVYRNRNLKVGVFGAQLTGPQSLLSKSVLTWMRFYLYLLVRTLISTVKEGILIQKVPPKLGRGWKAVRFSTMQYLFELHQQHPHKSCCAGANKKSWILCLV